MFGAGFTSDAFQLGFRIPNLTRDLFAEGALTSAFVPIFTQYLTSKGPQAAAALSNLVATALILIVGGGCFVGAVFAPGLVNLLAHGFHEIPGKYELAVTMTRIMFPFLLLVALAAQAMGILNACGKFGVPAMSSTMFNLGSVVFGIFIGRYMGPHIGVSAIEGMAYGVVLGGALQLLWQVPSLYKLGFFFKPAIDWSDPGLQRIFRMMGPAILGNAAVQINVMVNTNFAASLGDGPVSWLGYSFRFMQLPLGIFGVAMASATLPSISRSAEIGNFDEFRRTMSRSLATVFLLTVPSSVGLIVLGQSIIGAIYQGGQFDLFATQKTAEALSLYAVGLIGYAGLKVVVPAFYALGDARTPMVVSLISIVINFTVASTLIRAVGFGHAGLAFSTSVVAIFNFVALFSVLRARLGGIYGRDLVASFSKVTVAAGMMGIAVSGSNAALVHWLGETRGAFLADLAVSIPIGLAVFYGVARMLKIPELEPALRGLAGPILRRFPGKRGKIR